MTSQTTRTTAATRPWRLSGTARKAHLVAHLISALGWLGVDVVLLVAGLGCLAGGPRQPDQVRSGDPV